MRDEHVAELAERRLLGLAHHRAAGPEERAHDGLARSEREEEREDAAEAALHVEEHAAHRLALVVADRRDERARERLGAQQPNRRHAHAARAADDARERVGGVPRADAGELADPVEVRIVDRESGCAFGHAIWFRSITKIGRPSPRTVMPASARAEARSAGTGFT